MHALTHGLEIFLAWCPIFDFNVAAPRCDGIGPRGMSVRAWLEEDVLRIAMPNVISEREFGESMLCFAVQVE